MGYVAATIELQHQFDEAGIKPDWVVVTSLGSTQGGLELGARALQLPWRVCGMAYMPTGKRFPCRKERLAIADATAELVRQP